MAKANFIVDFDGIRKCILTDYNKLVSVCKEGVSPLGDVTVDGHELDQLLASLKESVLLLAALEVDNMPSLVSKEGFINIDDFDIEYLTS